MWQRKQTVFLSIVVACMALSIFLPIWKADHEGMEKSLYPLHYTVKEGETRNTVYIPYSLTALLAIAAATLALFSIGKFENRLLQLKLGALNSLLMAGSMACATYFAVQLIKSNSVAGNYGYGFWTICFMAMLCNAIANRFIRKDEKLVRDSDRLR